MYDYATIVLLDQRYTQPRIQNKLPKWIAKNIVVCNSFGPAIASIGKVSFKPVISLFLFHHLHWSNI